MTLFDDQDKMLTEAERYILDQIKQLFDYDNILQEHPSQQQDIDSVMNILYTTMNTTKATIRIAKENKPAMSVISKLMKLNKESIIYSINKYLKLPTPFGVLNLEKSIF